MLCRELLQKRQMRGIELVQRGKRDHGLDLVLEHDREATRTSAGHASNKRRIRCARCRAGILRDVDAALFDAHWPTRPSPRSSRTGIAAAVIVGVSGEQLQVRVILRFRLW